MSLLSEKPVEKTAAPEQKKGAASWAPARVLDIPSKFKDPRFVYRWVSKVKVGRVQKMLSEGWEIDKDLSKKMSGDIPSTIEDGKPVDGSMHRRNLIVMRLPKEQAQARAEFYAKRSGEAVEAANQELRASGQEYTPK